jgi:hemoglobin
MPAMDRPIYVPPSGPPQSGPSRDIYALMGEENIFKMLADFYQELGKSSIASMFPADLTEASQKSAKFFVQVLGGPPLYVIDHGPPRMRARHIPFEIDEAARQVWLSCFMKVLENADKNYNFPMQHMVGFKDFLEGFSAWMVNKS